MIGYARARGRLLTSEEADELKTYYCGLCHALRQDYGLVSSVLTGWDGRFIALLLDSQLHSNHSGVRTLCPAALGLRTKTAIGYAVATRYAAAVSVLLAGEKIADGVRDDGSAVYTIANRLTKGHINRAQEILEEFGFPLAKAHQIHHAQTLVEQRARNGSLTLAEVTDPTARAVSLIFSYTSVLADAPENFAHLQSIGSSVGRLVNLIDACHDHSQDMDSGNFNTISAASSLLAGNKETLGQPNFQLVENFLLLQLHAIRSRLSDVTFKRNQKLIENILVFGLYDSAKAALQELAKSLRTSNRLFLRSNDSLTCSICGVPGETGARYCTYCGWPLEESAAAR